VTRLFQHMRSFVAVALICAAVSAEFFVPEAFHVRDEKEIERNSTQSDDFLVQGTCAGTCQNTAYSCSSGYKSGMCPGSGSFKCCPQPTPSCNGQCQDTSLPCSGSYVSGLCPGPAAVKCCTASRGGGGGGTCTAAGTIGGVTLCQFGTCRVSTTIGTNFASMMNAASSAGINMGCAASFRDPADQIRLRRQNCGTTQYDIYQKPSGQCSPPTAIPGTSMHEKGLAVDLNCNGASFAGTRCFSWMVSNAHTYGFYNYAPEPWHWSTTGR